MHLPTYAKLTSCVPVLDAQATRYRERRVGVRKRFLGLIFQGGISRVVWSAAIRKPLDYM